MNILNSVLPIHDEARKGILYGIIKAVEVLQQDKNRLDGDMQEIASIILAMTVNDIAISIKERGASIVQSDDFLEAFQEMEKKMESQYPELFGKIIIS